VVVHVDVTHTYVGDLVVKLKHGGAEETLLNREGGSGSDIDRDFLPSAFAGLEAQGDWVLTVSDNASADTGTLNSWSIKIVPAY
jgi:serine protease